MLVIAIIAGVSIYLVYHGIPGLHPAGPFLYRGCKVTQTVLLFAMLFLSFCKVEPRQIRPQMWMLWLLLIQGGVFAAIAALLALFPDIRFKLGLETIMLCLITPTGTACAVVTGKLGGNMAGVVSYTVLVNLLVSLMVPALIPFVHPVEGLSFLSASWAILSKVFPLLVLPLLSAWLVRYCFPRLHRWLLGFPNLGFYLWAVGLTLAMLVSTRALVRSGGTLAVLAELAFASLLSCAFQFIVGRRIGAGYGCRISAGQSMGQKNTLLMIWMAYTFLDPVVSVAGGFYSIWHNTVNTWQLYRKRISSERN